MHGAPYACAAPAKQLDVALQHGRHGKVPDEGYKRGVVFLPLLPFTSENDAKVPTDQMMTQSSSTMLCKLELTVRSHSGQY